MGRGGDRTNVAVPGLPDFLLTNAQFAPFLDKDFDAGEFASNALADAHITAQAQNDQLQVWTSSVSKQLRNNLLYFSNRNILHCQGTEQYKWLSEKRKAFAQSQNS